MCEEEVSLTAIQDKVDEFLVLKVTLKHHIGYYLWDVVLEVISLFVAVNHWIDSFVG